MNAKPIIKWAGGKRQLLPQLLSLVPEKVYTYYEPFFGGGALFFELANLKAFGQGFIADSNPELVNVYKMVRDLPTKVADHLDDLIALGFSRESYNTIRSTSPDLAVASAARTIYLNKCGFNGLYRQNKSGKFNVPWGKRESVTVYDPDAIYEASSALRNAYIDCADAVDLLRVFRPSKGDFVYLDPPYVPASATSDFVSYTSDGFTMEDQKRVRRTFGQCADAGAAIVASNSDTPLVRDLYSGFDIMSVQARRSINSKGGKRGPVGEVLIYANTKPKEIG